CVVPVCFAQDKEAEKITGHEGVRTRTPAQVMSYRGAPWLERATRDDEEKPYEVIAAMKLKEGDVVADIGVGTGYYARKIARVVGEKGKVYGVDIQPEMLEMLMEFCEKQKIKNIKPVQGEYNDPKLPKESIDWMILTDVYHEFSHPEEMLAKMLEALKPTGKVLLLEYRLDGPTARHIKVDHRMSVEQVKSEWLPAGFELLKLEEFLPTQHLFIFGKGKAKK
ncbi:class I SAM-dependent methyltransferase, partial [bacterium AH-315-P07]|nr:class I SAM-dependent methyltransferase [bacterium AH-315-P07]